MSERHLVCILTAILMRQDLDLSCEDAVFQAFALARGGMGEREMRDAVDTVTGGLPTSAAILHDVETALALAERAAGRQEQWRN